MGKSSFKKGLLLVSTAAFLLAPTAIGQTDIDSIINAQPLPDELQANNGIATAANAGFELGFEDLLSIVLTQLTFQDPLKPVENFEFVSQLAQFSQIQQTETMSNSLQAILQAESTNQAATLLGRTVDVPAGTSIISGRVIAVSFEDGLPRLTIETEDDQTISNINLSNVTQVREGG